MAFSSDPPRENLECVLVLTTVAAIADRALGQQKLQTQSISSVTARRVESWEEDHTR